MRIRDALEADAEVLASLAGRPTDVMTDMIHDRAVRVAVPEADSSDDEASRLGDEGTGSEYDTEVVNENEAVNENENVNGKRMGTSSTVVGFVSFDVRSNTVHVTDFAGPENVTRQLFEEPRRFAVREGMNVEVVVADDNDWGRETVEGIGFAPVGQGPRFEGESTTRFRLEPSEGGKS